MSNPYDSKDAPVSPFIQAQQHWDKRMGIAISHARNWRALALLCLILAFFLAAGLLYQTSQATVYTYVVELDKTGQPGRIVLADNSYQPNKQVVAYTIGEVIKKTRSRPSDIVVLSRNWNEARNFIVGKAWQRFAEFGKTIDRAVDSDKAISVEIRSIVEKSSRTMQVEWVENHYSNGRKGESKTFVGLFTYAVAAPQDQEQVFKNPIGIFITDASWALQRL